MKIVVLGSPGVGKGTYTKELVKILNLVHISTGDIFREHIKNQTELGKKAKEYLDAGRLVPDELTIALIKERLAQKDAQKGFVLDGFPRNVLQAEALEKITSLNVVINFKADPEIITERLSGRRTCKKCGRIFHVKHIRPKVEGVCDLCGGELVQRSDETPEVIQERLKVYEEQTAPLIDYYQNQGLLKEVIVNEDFGTHKEKILNKILEAINLAKS